MIKIPLKKLWGKKQEPAATATPFDPAKLVFSPEFVTGSIEIAKKEIGRYIKGKSHHLGEDYYYAYTYVDGRLSFVATRLDRHVSEACLSVISLAFMVEGAYYYKQESKNLVYLVTNKAGAIKTEVCHEIPEGFSSLAEIPLPAASTIPKTLFLKWSLKKQTFYRDIIFALVLTIAAGFYLFTSRQFAEVTKAVSSIRPEPPKTEPQRLKLAKTVDTLAKSVDNKASIRKLTISSGKAEIRLRFPSETRALEYIAINGGRYDKNSEVVLTPPLPSWQQPVSDDKGGKDQSGRDSAPGKGPRRGKEEQPADK